MLESIFIITMCIGFISLILAIDNDNIMYSLISLLMWIVVFASHIYIEVPSIDETFHEVALFPIALGFIFINIIFIIDYYIESSTRRRMRL